MDMDHGDHGGGGGSSNGTVSCPMIMTFHAGHCERILWKSWQASTVSDFVLSALAIFVMAFVYEALKFLREYLVRSAKRNYLEKQASVSNNSTGNSNTPLADYREQSYLQRISNPVHLVQTLLNAVQIILSYLLMLVFMTFNYWLCLAVVLGLGIGYFFFGWIRQDVFETECCN